MHRDINRSNRFGVLNTIAFVLFCFAIGEATAIFLTSLLYKINAFQILETLKEPANSNRSVLVSFAFLSTLFRFMIIPGLYLLLTSKHSLNFLWSNNSVRVVPLILTIGIVFFLMPSISTLIELNYKLALPAWLSELETYFQDSEKKASQLTNYWLAFREPKDLITVILIVAIVPGIAEEFFFRGIVQVQLQNTFRNHHYAIVLSAALFSCFHLQFYGFIPRMALGVIFGYIFFWSKNIRYPSIAHVSNNLIGVFGVYFFGPQIMNPQSNGFMPVIFILLSLIVSALIILRLKRIWQQGQPTK